MNETVAVVVATYDRPALVEELVSSLLDQDHPDLEIVVVDDGSPPSTAAVLESLVARDPRGTVRTIRLDSNGGQARARNVGWRSTAADVVLFTDDDCRATPSWARELSARVHSTESDIVQGLTRADTRDEIPMGPWDRTLRISRWSGYFEACNIAYRRSTLEDVGGFDESFRAGEDADLGLRAVERGARVSFADDAVVEHTIWRQTFRGYVRDRLRSVHLVRLVKRHPELRRRLPYRIFWQRNHARTAAGLLVCGSAGILHLALPPALLASWVAAKSRNAPGHLPRRLRIAGLRLVASATEVAVMAAASLRHRCLLL